MKRIKVQRGYLAQNPYKRAKFYDQSFENVRNPPRTPHLQTYGKKYDLMKLLQVVTALMQLKKNEENKSPVVRFKEGMKRNMERIKPVIASGAAEQYFLGKTALDSLYKKTMEEIREMLFLRASGTHGDSNLAKLVKETDDERQEAYRNSGKYEIIAEFVKDLVKQYKGQKELGLLASRINDDLENFKDEVTKYIKQQKINDDEKAKQIFAIEREIREFFNPQNLDANASIADNSGLRALYPIMRKKALVVPSNISSANAILDGVEDGIAMDRIMEAEKIYYDPQYKDRILYMNLTGQTPTDAQVLLTGEFIKEHPKFLDDLEKAKLRLDAVKSGKSSYAPGNKTVDRQIRNAQKEYNELVGDLKHYIFVQNQTYPVALMPGASGSMDSNNTLPQRVLASIPVTSIPLQSPAMSLPTS